VIEFLLGRLPVNEIEVLAIVLQVATHTIFPMRILQLHVEVIAMLVQKILGDFLVAIEALKCGSASAENVAGTALSCSRK